MTEGRARRRRVSMGRLSIFLCLTLLLPAPALAEDDVSRVPPATHVDVPSMQGFTLAQSRAVLKRRGLDVGTVYGMSRERIYAYLVKFYPSFPDPLGYAKKLVYQRVFVHNPRERERLELGSTVDVVLVSRSDGPLPPEKRFRELEVRALPREASEAVATQPVKPPDSRPELERPAPDAVPPRVPEPTPAPEPTASQPETAPAVEPETAVEVEVPTSVDGGRIAAGSPDAPRAAPKADRNVVPPLEGLDLRDAEQLVRDAEMELYVERVAGHPVGRVLEQVPAAGSPRQAGGVVKVVITAGGDFEAAMPDSPAVHVDHVDVPELLDRTVLQAERILMDLGFRVTAIEATSGLPGRVVDQKPGLGERVARGSEVRIWIGPGEPRPAPDGPSLAPGPAPSSAASGARGTIPVPIAPTAGTALPPEATIPVGFSWRGVKDAEAYLIEVEEQAADGTWIAGARKRTRTTAAMVDLERLDAKTPRPFRWRVQAIVGGKPAGASEWLVLN